MSSSQDRSVPSLNNLPPEILEKIFLESENLDLQKVSRRFYHIINDDIVLLQFCTKIFYEGRLSEDVKVANLQNSILSHPCFTSDFAARVEQAVLKLQEPDLQKFATDKWVWNDCSEQNQIRCANGTRLPRRLLLGPWTNDNISLLDRLMRWEAIVSPDDRDAAGRGMTNAIMEARPKVVDLLRSYVKLDQTYLKLAVLKAGCDISIVRMFSCHLELFVPHLHWQDKEIMSWARNEAKIENEGALWLLRYIKSKEMLSWHDFCYCGCCDS